MKKVAAMFEKKVNVKTSIKTSSKRQREDVEEDEKSEEMPMDQENNNKERKEIN